jgi:hypothetical protein
VDAKTPVSYPAGFMKRRRGAPSAISVSCTTGRWWGTPRAWQSGWTVFEWDEVVGSKKRAAFGHSHGIALDCPLQSQVPRSVPDVPAFESAWRDFYPQSR